MKRVTLDGASTPARILIDGVSFCTLTPTAGGDLADPHVSAEGAREMSRMICVCDALEAHVAKEPPLEFVAGLAR